MKLFFHYSKLDRLLAALFRHTFELYLNEHPEVFHVLRTRHANANGKRLLARIKNKGEGVIVNGEVTITHPLGMVIGNNVHIGNNAYIHSRGGVVIGDNTHISRNFLLYTCNHTYQEGALPFDSGYIDKPVVIGRNVWVGMNVNVTPGVTIGEGAIIGMGVTVSKDVAPFEIIGSAPSRILKHRHQEHYRHLHDTKQFGAVNGRRLGNDQVSQFRQDARSKGSKLFFVLGTGRSGSTSITKILSQHSGVTCLHEPKFQLLRLSTLWLYGEISKEEVERELATLFLEANVYPSNFYGESDQKLVPLIPFIAEMLPEAKFVWLIRNPRDTVNSTFSRGWFTDWELGLDARERVDYPLYREVYSDYRPQADKIGLLSTNEWQGMSAFERNCWYWTYWNSQIGRFLEPLDASRHIKIKLEELASSIPDLLTFLGLAQEPIMTKISNTAENRHKLHTIDDWTPEMQSSFKKWCVANRLYY
ncbi:sulfotransferase [Congregibacter variabilis]|uniref:Sulfotransferase n=1 Tax=Congregibacter variabilis TaxID=3081200 RepID=A0ABZ0I707_9GAMM|nr:sulfotransferase [Congregibacter sp. IMCC43200]